MSDSDRNSTPIPLPAVLHYPDGPAAPLSSSSAMTTLERSSKHSLAPVPIDVFLSHVDELRRSDGFSKEFQALQDWEKQNCHLVKEEDCRRPENRYPNIVACTLSRDVVWLVTEYWAHDLAESFILFIRSSAMKWP